MKNGASRPQVFCAGFNGDRAEAAEALGKIKDPRAFDVLVAALNDPTPVVRVDAARALVKLDDPRAVTHLLPLLNQECNYTRNAAMSVLAEFDDPQVAPALIKAADHPDEDTRRWALLNLAKVNGPGVLDKLIAALADESRHSEACVALARRNEKQIPKLIQARLPPRDATKAIQSIRRIRNNIKQEQLRQQRHSRTP